VFEDRRLYISTALLLCSKTEGCAATVLCERSLRLWYSVRRPTALHIDDSVQRPKAVLLPYIVNALCDCGTRFEDRRICDSVPRPTAMLLPYTVNALCLCERPSALLVLMLLLYIASLAIYWWVHVLNIIIIFLWKGTVNRVNEEVNFSVYSKFIPLMLQWRCRHCHLGGLSST